MSTKLTVIIDLVFCMMLYSIKHFGNRRPHRGDSISVSDVYDDVQGHENALVRLLSLAHLLQMLYRNLKHGSR